MVDRIVKEGLTLHSSDAFLKGLIDYAGLFPPARLPLRDAVKNYATYVNNADYWMLGSFVNPAFDLHELDEYVSLFTKDKPLSISTLGRKGKNEQETLEFLKEDLGAVESFRERHGERVVLNFFELPLSSLNLSTRYLSEIGELMAQHKLSCYCELPIQSQESSWKSGLAEVLRSIAKQNESTGHLLGIKLRTGGIRADLIPPLEVVAAFIHGGKAYKIPAKFTAGLHHPIRMFRDEVQTKMHGFLNVFTAALMANAHNLNESSILEILSDEKSKGFAFKRDRLVWNDLDVSTEMIKKLRRKLLCSYGSCSFDEPREELKALNIIERS